MKVYFLNLDRHPLRKTRMCELLEGLPYERIHAVDGKTLEGPEVLPPFTPRKYENMTRYERAYVLGHRLAWQKFLETGDALACVLDDDVALSPEFGKFMRDESWFPQGGCVVKIETDRERVFLSRQSIPALGRSLAVLRSSHLGSSAYVISREGARFFLGQTVRPDHPLDYVMFGEAFAKNRPPVHQLIPALCIQTKHIQDANAFSELASSIQDQASRPKKPFRLRLRNEIRRPFIQLGRSLRNLASGRQLTERRCIVDFA
jgi:glycosyl transferase, family 25